MHDVVDPYYPRKRPDELEASLRHLEVRMERQRYLDSIAGVEEIMQRQSVKEPALVAKQARLLRILRHF